MPRVMVLGLDCVPAALAFGSLGHVMPNLSRLAAAGAHGPLRSTTPPITVPAWACMFSGRDPGEVGLYGFRSRTRGTYELTLPDSRSIKVKRAWDWLGEAGHRVAVLFVPPGHPPAPVRGVSASCFLYANDGSPWTYPAGLGAELEAAHGPYVADVGGYRDRSDADLARRSRR
jgi:predicted AlkP superfamily phosphohydrolase/phosphomutase